VNRPSSDWPESLAPLARQIGAQVARKLFEARGNHSEVHVTERELTLVVAVAVQTAVNVIADRGARSAPQAD
jgi:hypothetical protein